MGGKVLEHEAKTILRRGQSEGRIEGRRDTLVELVRDGLLSISEAAKRLNMNEEELRKYL
jgi:predicted transposase YdaD